MAVWPKVSWVAVLAGCCALAIVIAVCVVLKLSVYRIATGSMQPEFPVGTIVIDSGVLPITAHHALTFTADGHTVTHVLLGYERDGSLITRGTANPSNDSWTRPVYSQDVKGSVLFQIRAFAPGFWTSRTGLIALFGVAVMAIATTSLRKMMRVGRVYGW